MSRRKTEKISSHPGIFRVLVLSPTTGKWGEPKRGAKFRATRYIVNDRGAKEKVAKYFDTFPEAKAFRYGPNPSPTPRAVQTQTAAPHAHGMTFRELAGIWERDWLPNKDISTAARYRKYLKCYECLMDMPVEQIGPLQIDRWIGAMKSPENLARGHTTRCTFEHEFTVLKIIFNFYTSRINRSFRSPFIADHKKMLKVREKPLVKKDLTVDHVSRFLAALKEICGERDCEAIYYLGLMQYAIYSRVQEAAALYYEDFDFERNKLMVRRKVQWLRCRGYPDRIVDGAKTNGGKQIELPELAKRTFREWVMKSGIRSGLLFRDGDTFLKLQADRTPLHASSQACRAALYGNPHLEARGALRALRYVQRPPGNPAGGRTA